jgi:hypothetical protein
MQGLIEKMGGADATEKRLDLMFVPNLRTVDLGVGVGSGTTLFNPGKLNQSHHSIFYLAVVPVTDKRIFDRFQATNLVSALHFCITTCQVVSTKP